MSHVLEKPTSSFEANGANYKRAINTSLLIIFGPLLAVFVFIQPINLVICDTKQQTTPSTNKLADTPSNIISNSLNNKKSSFSSSSSQGLSSKFSNLDNIMSAIELQHLGLKSSSKSHFKHSTPSTQTLIINDNNYSNKKIPDAKQTAMQSIVQAHELSALKHLNHPVKKHQDSMSSSQSSSTPVTDSSPSQPRLGLKRVLQLASIPTTFKQNNPSYSPMSYLGAKQNSSSSASSSGVTLDKLRRNNRQIIASVEKKFIKSAKTFAAKSLPEPQVLSSGGSSSSKKGLLATIGDKALRAAMIKPSIGYYDLVGAHSTIINKVVEPIYGSGPTISTSSLSSPANVVNETPRSVTSTAFKKLSKAVSSPTNSSSSLSSIASSVANSKLFQESFRNLITLTQLPLLTSSSQQLPFYATLTAPKPIAALFSSSSSSPSALFSTTSSTTPTTSKPKKNTSSLTGQKASTVPAALTLSEQKRKTAVEEFVRLAYIMGNRLSGANDPLKSLSTSGPSMAATVPNKTFTQRSKNPIAVPNRQFLYYLRQLRNLLLRGPRPIAPVKKNNAYHTHRQQTQVKPRGVMWDMATDPALAVTLFHLIESASVALPLGFLLMPFVRLLRSPLNGIDFNGVGVGGLNRIFPTRATHRSVDYEELAKRLDVIDKLLSQAMRQTHREASSSTISTFTGR